MKISEKQLRKVIRESIKSYISENYIDEYYSYYDDEKAISKIYIHFNPQTFEIVNITNNFDEDFYRNNKELGYCEAISSDFPDALIGKDHGDYWNQPEYHEYIGKCGGDFEIEDFELPFDDYDDEKLNEDEKKFIEINRERIIEALEEYAEFI